MSFEVEDDQEEFDEEENEMEDENSEEEELISEMSEERGGLVYLRYRDSNGRFASEVGDPEHISDLKMDRKIRKFCREYDKKIQLPYNEKVLLLRLVDDFRDREKFFDIDGFYDPKVSHFKRLLYHEVLKSCSMKRSAFSQFVNRMVEEGVIAKIKHGHKLYLRITEKGLDKVFKFWEEYSGESWRDP